jgi:endonuclease G
VNWLSIGQRSAEAVGKIDTPAGSGTGFMVSPWLLMTNNHVISDSAAAARATVTFRYQQDGSGNIKSAKTLNLDPDRFFRTSPRNKLDYALVAVAPAAGGKPPGDVYGFVPLIGGTGKILKGEAINIVQHPQGRPKEIAFRNNLMLRIDDEEKVTYQTDTDSGSSGSPVFNDQWEMVALHHKSVEASNAAGVKIDRLGRPVTEATPDNLRVWVANEGIRVSALVRDIQASSYRGARRQLVDEVLGRS